MTRVRNWRGHSGATVDGKNGFEIIECSQCRFKHIVPIPSEEELKRIYLSEYYTTEKPLYIERNLEDQEWWRVVYEGRLELFERLLGNTGRDILDIGCGPGFFLQHAMKRGWNAVGVEPSVKAAEFGVNLGVEIKNEFLSERSVETLGTFDVVYMNEVLEHIPNPFELLQIAKGVLKPEGLLCVIVPNDYNPIQNALRTVCGYPSWWVAPPHHVNYFDVSSIQSLVRRVGMTIVYKEATFPIDLFLMMGDNYVGNDELGRRCHGKRKTLEVNLERAGLSELRQSLYRSFAELGIGREIQVIGRKKKGNQTAAL